MSADTTHALSALRPFPGLRPFAFEDHEYFFGREDQAFELFRRLDRSRFIAVVGSSGSGKSSLLRAGLRPLIADETADEAGRSWRWVEMRPGDAPLVALAAGLSGLAPQTDDEAADAGRRERFLFTLRQSRFGLGEVVGMLGEAAAGPMLLLVDQFEEVFRFGAGTARGRQDGREAASSREESIQFVQHLLQAARDAAQQIYVMLTMRSDFIGDCARFQGLPEAVSGSQFLVPGLTRDQREQVIRGPIDKAGAAIEPGLVERLLNDASDELDQLPVLQHGLQRLWETAQPAEGERRHLRQNHYEQIGGLAEALSRHANAILDELPGDEIAVEQVFRALSEVDREGRATRRALPYAQLLAETGVDEPVLRRVLDRFRDEDCSFLVPALSAAPRLAGETRIDVGHEALLRRWDKISRVPAEDVEGEVRRGGWLWQEDADGQTYHALLALREGGRTLPLDQVEARWAWWNERPRTAAWADRYGGHIDRVETLFTDSLDALAADRRRLAAEQRRQRRVLVGTVGALVVSLVLAGVAGWQWDRAATARRDADTQRAAAEAGKNEAVAERLRAENSLALATDTVNGLIFDVVQKYRDAGVPLPIIKAILDRALELQSQLATGGEATPRLRRSQAEALMETVDTLLLLGDAKSALDAAQKSRDILLALKTAFPDSTDYPRELAVAENKLGDVLRAQDNSADALAEYQDAQTLIEALTAKDPTNTQWQYDLGIANERIGDVELAQRDYPAALKSYQTKRDIISKLVANEPDNTYWQRDLSVAEEKVGDVLLAQNDLPGALASYQASLKIRKMLTAKDPSNTEYQRDLSVSDDKIGAILQTQNDLKGALAACRESLAIRKALVLKDPGNTQWQRDLSIVDNNIGDILDAQSDHAGALASYRDAQGILQSLVAMTPGNTDWEVGLAYSDASIGALLKAQGDLPGALSAYKAVLAIARALIAGDPDNPQWQSSLAVSERSIAQVLEAQGDYPDAIAADRDSVKIRQGLIAKNPSDKAAQENLSKTLGELSWLLLLSNQPQEALDDAQQAAVLNPTAVWIKINEAHALLLVGRFDDAKAIYLANAKTPVADGRTFADVIKDDFAELRKHGIDTPAMKQIEALLAT